MMSLPTYWVGNADGSVTERGGRYDGWRKTSPTGSYITQPVVGGRRIICGTQAPPPSVTRDVARHVVAQQNLISNVRDGRKCVVYCDMCKRDNIEWSYSLGNVDICIACADSLAVDDVAPAPQQICK